jgi:hypothetical protein
MQRLKLMNFWKNVNRPKKEKPNRKKMLPTHRGPTHPGEMLLEDFLVPFHRVFYFLSAKSVKLAVYLLKMSDHVHELPG